MIVRNYFFILSVIYLFSSSINKTNWLLAKLNAAFLNDLRFFVFNKVYICEQANPVIEAVVEAIVGIILPTISFTFKN